MIALLNASKSLSENSKAKLEWTLKIFLTLKKLKQSAMNGLSMCEKEVTSSIISAL